MTPSEKRVVRSLVAVAWADGQIDPLESGVIEGMLLGFDASPEEEAELFEYARSRRSLDDIPLAELSRDERNLLFSNAVLLTRADGTVTGAEGRILGELARRLGLRGEEAMVIAKAVIGAAPK